MAWLPRVAGKNACSFQRPSFEDRRGSLRRSSGLVSPGIADPRFLLAVEAHLELDPALAFGERHHGLERHAAHLAGSFPALRARRVDLTIALRFE